GRLNEVLVKQGFGLPKISCLPKCLGLGFNPMAQAKCLKDCISGKEPQEESEEESDDEELDHKEDTLDSTYLLSPVKTKGR
ncbi:unnamed protein product, partial [Allacma fusca]